MRNIERYNQEHYPDPTAADAIDRSDRQPNRISEFVNFTKKYAAASGLEIVGRIKIRDKKSGKIYP